MIDENGLCFDSILHVEGGFFDQREQTDIRILDPEDMQSIDHVYDDLFAFLNRGTDQQSDIGDRQHLVVGRDLDHNDMSQKSVRADQVVDLVEYGHEKITGLGIAAHEGVGAAGPDHLYGVLDNVGIIADRLDIELAV